MRYNMKKYMLLTTLSVGISLFALDYAKAQNVVSLVDDVDNGLPILEAGKADNTLPVASGVSPNASSENDVLFDEPNAPAQITTQDSALPPQPAINNVDNSLGINDANMGQGGIVNLPAGQEGLMGVNPAGIGAVADPNGMGVIAPPQPTPEEIERERAIAEAKRAAADNELTDSILKKLDDGLFSQMSDIEKQTALLTLELRKEKVKNDIKALELQRKKAEEEDKNREEERLRKIKEWENEQERLLLAEQQKLQALENIYETLRQEKLVKAYKEHALEEEQKWIQSFRIALEEAATAEASRNELVEDFKKKLAQLAILANKNFDGAKTAKENFEREMSTIRAQVSILRSRLEATEHDSSTKINPFASGSSESTFVETESILENSKIAELYSIVEIRGQGENVVAKLKNKSGNSFTVKKGTILQTGHTVEEITQTFIRADKDGIRDYIFFSTGGAIEKEPVVSQDRMSMLSDLLKKRKAEKNSSSDESGPAVSSGMPSLSKGMFVR